MKSKLLAITTAYTKALTNAITGTVAKAITLAIAIAVGIVATTTANAQTAITQAGTYPEGTYTIGNIALNAGVAFTGDATLTLDGNSSITVSTTDAAGTGNVGAGGTVGIWVNDNANLTINGTGTLTIDVSASASDAAGIALGTDASVTLSGGTLSAKGSTSWSGTAGNLSLGAGVRNSGGTFTLDGGTLLIDAAATGANSSAAGFYNSLGTGTAALVDVKSGTISKPDGTTATVTNASLAATVNVGPNTNVDVDPGLPAGVFAPYYTITTTLTNWTAVAGKKVILEGTNLGEQVTTPSGAPFNGAEFDNITHFIFNGTGVVPSYYTTEDSIAFQAPTTAGTYKVQTRFQILQDATSTAYYLTKTIGTLNVSPVPTVTVVKGSTGTASVSQAVDDTDIAGKYTFTAAPIVELDNGTFTLTDESNNAITATQTGPDANGDYTFTLIGITADKTVNVNYTGTTTVKAGKEGLTVTQPTAGANDTISFDATPEKADKTGIFTFTYSVDGTALTTNTPKATVGELTAGKYIIKLSAPEGTTAIPGNLLVKVNYSIPAVDEPTVDEELPTITPDEISEENAGNAFILVGGKDKDTFALKIDPVVNSSKLVPGTTYTTKVTTTTTIAAGEKLTISFTGALATVVPPIEVEKPTQDINPGEFAVIFVFQSSEATELKTAKSKADPVTTSTSKAEFKNGILYIYLIGIKEDALGDTPSTAQINTTTEDGETTNTVAIINDEITLFTHPINLTINNTVPANNYTGSFTITGDYIEGSLYYRIGDEKYKVYPGSIPQSEIARLANGELLYLTLDKEDFKNVIVYVPNTFEGTSPSPIPQNRNVTVLLAKDGSIITTGLTSNDEFKFTFTPTVSYEDGTVELTFTRDGVTVQNPPTVTGTEAPIDGTYNITLTKVKTSNLVVTLHYNTTTQIQIVTDNKVWTDNNILYIQTKNNGTAIVYDVNGKIVKTVATKQGINNIHLNSGVYVVKTNGIVSKVAVK